MTADLPQSVTDIAGYLKAHGYTAGIDAAIILGSGLGDVANMLEDAASLPYNEIPGFPLTSVSGHKGKLYCGRIQSRKVLAFSGRFHAYEGLPVSKTVLPVQLAHALGAELIIITNAAGAINYRFQTGDLMLIDDLIRMGSSLSVGRKMSCQRYHNPKLIKHACEVARTNGICVQKGSYVYTKGPSYETKAEIRAFRILGADAVGMSTAAELIEAERLGMNSLGISLIANMAAGIKAGKLDHNDIQQAARLRQEDFRTLIRQLILSL